MNKANFDCDVVPCDRCSSLSEFDKDGGIRQ